MPPAHKWYSGRENLTSLPSPQVQEKGTYDLLAPLALLFYSTVLCVSTAGPGAKRGEGRVGSTWTTGLTSLRINRNVGAMTLELGGDLLIPPEYHPGRPLVE